MGKQFIPCPACGAVGEVGSNCQFCNTVIILKEGVISSTERIPQERTITPQQYAEKIAIYHDIVGIGEGILKVSIGKQEGVVNLNGDLIYPLGNEPIKGFNDKVVQVGEKYFNLELSEFVKNPYCNDAVLEKIKILSDSILNNPSEKGWIGAGFWGADEFILSVCNASDCYVNNCYGLTPQLMININFDFARVGMEKSLYERIKSCDDFGLIETRDTTIDGKETQVVYYILCGHDTERCCEIFLRILYQVFDMLPDEVASEMGCYGGVFGSDKWDNSDNVQDTNGGCLGMLALLVSIGGAAVYGLTQLISNLIA